MLQHPTPRLILASASASRRVLLAGAGLRFEVRPADIDEAAVKLDAQAGGMSIVNAALRLADLKAAATARLEPEALVIGADQILVCDGVWYDKPNDIAGAREQLGALRGRRHMLATGVVCHQGESRVWHDAAMPCLTMRNFSDDFLDRYLAAEADTVISTVGAYRLEGRGVQLFDAIEGEHSAILGLPLLPLLSFLRFRRVLFV
ncbi:MAG TPA: Maf family protein [Acetobacteraceae bacterium]|nr:Maf family protein [Acetobacteraceae bacterium]